MCSTLECKHLTASASLLVGGTGAHSEQKATTTVMLHSMANEPLRESEGLSIASTAAYTNTDRHTGCQSPPSLPTRGQTDKLAVNRLCRCLHEDRQTHWLSITSAATFTKTDRHTGCQSPPLLPIQRQIETLAVNRLRRCLNKDRQTHWLSIASAAGYTNTDRHWLAARDGIQTSLYAKTDRHTGWLPGMAYRPVSTLGQTDTLAGYQGQHADQSLM
jgi:hypothetical protein